MNQLVLKYISVILLSVLSLCVSSCTPDEGDVEGLYKEAQEGNENAMFAIVNYYETFEKVVPKDSLQKYEMILIANGDYRALWKASSREVEEYGKAHPDENWVDYNDSIHTKWNKIGIQNNISTCYGRLENSYRVRYLNYHNERDYILADKYYQLALENNDINVMYKHDMKAGIFPLIFGGVEYGAHYFSAKSDVNFVGRLFEGGMQTANYITSGLVKLLFSSQWWQVILTFVVIVAIVVFVMNRLVRLGDFGIDAPSPAMFGMVLGAWDSILLFVAYNNEITPWVGNVFRLWPDGSAYGIQPYLCIIPNWLVIIGLIAYTIVLVKRHLKVGLNVKKLILQMCVSILVFILCYILTGFIGMFTFILGAIILVAIIGVLIIKSTPRLAAGIVDEVATPKTKKYTVTDNATGEKFDTYVRHDEELVSKSSRYDVRKNGPWG